MALESVLVGYGYWGKNIARNVFQSSEFSLLYLVEPDSTKRQEALALYPGIKCFESLDEYLMNGNLAQVGFIATAANTHFDIAKHLLMKKHNLWIEKPVTLDSNQAVQLKKLSESLSKIIIVDHTYLYSPAINRMRTEITKLDGILSITSIRHGFGKVQSDSDVMWDLAVHDLAIFEYFIGKKATKVRAFPITTDNTHATSAIILVDYGDIRATISCSWLSPMKIRDMQILCDNGSIFFDELDVTEKIKIINQRVEIEENKGGEKIVNYRLGDTFIPEIPNEESLTLAVKEFGKCINEQKQPISNIDLAIRVVSILEAASISAKTDGLPQELNL